MEEDKILDATHKERIIVNIKIRLRHGYDVRIGNV